jgi:hypothetical protein
VNPFQNFLSKFAKILEAPAAAKKPLIEVVARKSGIVLREEEILIKDTVAQLTTTPAVRNEIFMRKRAILSELQAFNSKITDIR